MKFSLRLVGITLLALAAWPAHGFASDLRDSFERTEATDVGRGARAYDAGKYDLALALLARPADDGDAEAQLLLGLMNWHGSGVPQDYAGALRWLRLSAAQGNARAMTALAVSYRRGAGVPADLAQAVTWYEKAAAAGEPRALDALAVLHGKGEGVAKDLTLACALWREAAAKGDAFAMVHLGDAYWYGKGVAADRGAALDWWRRATADPRITFVSIAQPYMRGQDTPKDESLAAQLFAAAAASGDAATEGALGWMYFLGTGVRQDWTRARTLVEDAARAGVTDAMVYAAVVDRRAGLLAESAAWARQAAETGDARGAALYGAALLDGSGTDKDVNEAVLWLRRAAARGDASGEFRLGVVYRTGAGILAKDTARALALFAQSAARRYAPAEVALGESDLGTDDAAALALFRDAAEQGDPDALNAMGVMLDGGRGVAKDSARAFDFYQRAASFAQPAAMRSLAGHLFAGIGAPRDPAKAYYWAQLALRYGDADDPDDLAGIAALRTQLLPSILRALPPAARARIDGEIAAFEPKTWFPPESFASPGATGEADDGADDP